MRVILVLLGVLIRALVAPFAAVLGVVLAFSYVQEGRWLWLIYPLVLFALSACLFLYKPPAIRAARKRRKVQHSAYLEKHPAAKRLESWSKWLGWIGVLLGAAWIFYACLTLSDALNEWEVWGVFGLTMLPWLILSILAARYEYRYLLRERYSSSSQS